MFESAVPNEDPVSVALVDVDRLGRIARKHGYELGDRIVAKLAATVRQHFAMSDVVATWATGRFVVGMAGLPKAEALQRTAELLETVRLEPVITTSGDKVRVSAKAGVAEYPADGSSVDEIINRADDAVAVARELGGDCVIPAGWDPERDPRLIDVAIVEDDAQLAEILSHSLTTRGVRTRWLRDGVEAVEALVGTATSPALMSPRVVLLDVNLPGINGIAVLRRIAEADGLKRTKVVMLTARSAEHDMMAALSLGAVDYVAKPFSVPVLLERLRHHLES
jgi:diguanylate cyclase (GGDEF)-like protein